MPSHTCAHPPSIQRIGESTNSQNRTFKHTPGDPSVPPRRREPADGGADAGTCFFREDFDDGRLDGWQTPLGTWVERGGEAVQTDDTLARAYAFAEATDGSTDLRLRARFRQLSGIPGGAIEITFGVNTASPLEQFFCNFEPNGADMVFMYSDAAGDSRSLQELDLDPTTMPGYDPMASYTMVLEIRGTSFRCWVEEVPGSEMIQSDPRYSSGAIGMKTYRMAAAYDWIEVCPVD